MTPDDCRGTIMIVDDEPSILQVLTRVLAARGYKVRAAPTARAALVSSSLAVPDLYLVDVRLPDMSGYELCERLKQEEALREVPVIFLSVLGDLLDKVRAFRVGGVDYLTKPFEIDEVEARVEAHMEVRRLQARLVERNLELERTCEQLRELERMRDGLNHLIIHDLRTPLTSIYGFLRLIDLRGRVLLPASLVECIDRSVCSTTELIEMVTSLLDVNKMEAGQMELERVECDLARIAADVLARLEVLCEGKELTLERPPYPVSVTGDPEMLRRILYNLVSNALKFVPARHGRIVVGVAVLPRGVRVTVDDNGPGIPAAYQERIFEKFGQVELRSHHRHYSTGLGLTFCKLAVEAHGGRIGVESEPPQGSRFWFELPAVAGVEADAALEQALAE